MNTDNSNNSTGPRTDAGKQTGSRSAIKHGYCSNDTLLIASELTRRAFSLLSTRYRQRKNMFNLSIRPAAFFMLGIVGSWAQAPQNFTVTVSTTGPTAGYVMGATNHTLQINAPGSPSACAVQLEGSLDNVNWANLSGSQSCLSSPTVFHVDGKPVTYIRANLTAYAGGSGSVAIFYQGAQ